jgi:hypothetical protein
VGAIAAATVLIASGLVAIGVSLASNTPDEADGGSTRTPSPVATTVADQSTPSPTATAPVAPAPAPPPAKPGPGKPDKPDKPGKKG